MWPTDGATRKYVDRAIDKQSYRIERLQKDVSSILFRILALEASSKEEE